MVAAERKEGKMQRCKDLFLVLEDFIGHWGRQRLRLGKSLSSIRTMSETSPQTYLV